MFAIENCGEYIVNNISVLKVHFFFQAEDGIRDFHVTGVQTCALPISLRDLPGFGADTTVLCPSADAPSHDSEALWALLCERGHKPRRVLLVRGTQGRDW